MKVRITYLHPPAEQTVFPSDELLHCVSGIYEDTQIPGNRAIVLYDGIVLYVEENIGELFPFPKDYVGYFKLTDERLELMFHSPKWGEKKW